MKLYTVATPIGNLEDMTFRAVRILGEVDVIACEDTRHSRTLLDHYQINKKLIACHSYNEEESSKGILNLLDQGLNVAYLSDAGTPGISDPGSRLCEYVRNNSDHEIVPIPGPSALITLLQCAGNIGKSFTFEGFLSPKKGRREKRLTELVERKDAFIIYESPFRILKVLEELSAMEKVKKLVIGRELTKIHEEILVDAPQNILARFKAKDAVKGEFVVIVCPENESDKHQEDQEPEA